MEYWFILSDFITWFRLENKMITTGYCYSCAMTNMVSLGNLWFVCLIFELPSSMLIISIISQTICYLYN